MILYHLSIISLSLYHLSLSLSFSLPPFIFHLSLLNQAHPISAYLQVHLHAGKKEDQSHTVREPDGERQVGLAKRRQDVAVCDAELRRA